MIRLSEAALGTWYSRLIHDAELADYSPTRGDIVIRPYGFAIWQLIMDSLNVKLRSSGHEQSYFPLLIPETMIEAETAAIDGLSPQVLTVTEGGGTRLTERLVIRPTSETIVNAMFAKWVQSYRDLPLKLYQWSNIARWEDRTRPFIKGREVLWLEGHSVHHSHASAIAELDAITGTFETFINDELAIPVLVGEEPRSRRFVGSQATYSVEMMTPNGHALQLAAVYDLGQKFSRLFDVRYKTQDNTSDYCWGINWGLGFRLIGALVLAHGDDRGLRLPPAVAPIQFAVVPLSGDDDRITEACRSLVAVLGASGIRAHLADGCQGTVGRCISHWEAKGVPCIVLVGDNELSGATLTILRRDRAVGENRVACAAHCVVDVGKRILAEIQESLHAQANTFQTENTRTVRVEGELGQSLNCGWAIGQWCGSPQCEASLLGQYGKVLRVKSDADGSSGAAGGERCFACGGAATCTILIAKSY